MIITAQWIVSLASPPLENGWIRIRGGTILELGSTPLTETDDEERLDLGDCALFPGFINCHAHLEFDRQEHPTDSFAAWAQSVQNGQSEDIETTWKNNAKRLLETGTTTVVNHGNRFPPAELTNPQTHQATNSRTHEPTAFPRIIQICEVVGSSPTRGAKSYQAACQQRTQLLKAGNVEAAFVSPHSLYAVSPLIWDEFAAQRQDDDLISIHFKESAEEDQLYREGHGKLASLVRERGGFLWQFKPLRWLRKKDLLRRGTLLVHANYLTETDIATLSESEASVIHCAGSHAYFGHQRFPLEALAEHEINIALGTDSLASNTDLNMLMEIQRVREIYPQLTAESILNLATREGARALGREYSFGTLEIGKKADLCAIQLNSHRDPFDALLRAQSVAMTMIDGKVVYTHGL